MSNIRTFSTSGKFKFLEQFFCRHEWRYKIMHLGEHEVCKRCGKIRDYKWR